MYLTDVWRLKTQRYILEGNRVPETKEVTFPPRPVAPRDVKKYDWPDESEKDRSELSFRDLRDCVVVLFKYQGKFYLLPLLPEDMTKVEGVLNVNGRFGEVEAAAPFRERRYGTFSYGVKDGEELLTAAQRELEQELPQLLRGLEALAHLGEDELSSLVGNLASCILNLLRQTEPTTISDFITGQYRQPFDQDEVEFDFARLLDSNVQLPATWRGLFWAHVYQVELLNDLFAYLDELGLVYVVTDHDLNELDATAQTIRPIMWAALRWLAAES